MATEVVKVIDPDMGSGYDYDSLFDWEAAMQKDLVAADEISVAKCRCTGGTADTTAVIIDGWTTDATRYCKVWTYPAEGYRHNGTYQTGDKYRMEVASVGANGILYPLEYIIIDGIQIKGTSTSATDAFGIGPEYPSTIMNCVVIMDGTHRIYEIWCGSGVTHKVLNCISIHWGSNGDSAPFYCSTGTSYFYNCTAISYADSFGIRQTGGACYAKNCYSKAGGTGYDYSGTITKTTCASSDSTGSTGLTSIAYNTTNFTNVTKGSENLHLPLGSALIGVATNLYNDADYPFQTDIDGQDRGGAAAAWDIGADEYVLSVAIEQEGFRFRNDDGSESAATWKANQDTNITLAADTAARIRMLLNATGDPASIGAQLEYRYKPSGGAFGSWTKVN